MTTSTYPFSKIIDDLSENGYAICDAFLPPTIIATLAKKASVKWLAGEMTPAKTGQQSLSLNNAIRGDSTFWLSEQSTNLGVKAYFNQMLLLKKALNANLFMNLHDIEAHLAVYSGGSAYQKHLDQFTSKSTPSQSTKIRLLSSVLYLNKDWQLADNGALRLYLNTQDIKDNEKEKAKDFAVNYIDIAPTAGKLALFLSHAFWHEVMPAKLTRTSLTAWFSSR
jgi:SM-20-related protein